MMLPHLHYLQKAKLVNVMIQMQERQEMMANLYGRPIYQQMEHDQPIRPLTDRESVTSTGNQQDSTSQNTTKYAPLETQILQQQNKEIHYQH
jgi:hypothetical protein